MKAKTKISDDVYVFFAYIDRTETKMSGYYGKNGCKRLCGYCVNVHWGVFEKIADCLKASKPTIAQVKGFMQYCIDALND
jgi:hypothetical protein